MKVIGFGEVMMRLTSADIDAENSFEYFIGGAEYNVITNLASLGVETSFLTKVPDNALGHAVVKHARKFGVNTDNIIQEGDKLGTYYAFVGNEYVPTNVVYDRKYSEFYFAKEYEFEKILTGFDILHISGVVPAINESTRKMAFDIIRCAKKLGLTVSYDSNYRGKLWCQEEAGKFLTSILPHCDIAFLGVLDIEYLLNYDCDDLVTGYKMIMEKYPNIQLLASTSRNIITQTNHELMGNIFNGELFNSRCYNVDIVDRIGTGDSFTAGVLYGYIKEMSPQETIDFGMANGVIKHYVKGDNYMAEVCKVQSLIANIGGRIER